MEKQTKILIEKVESLLSLLAGTQAGESEAAKEVMHQIFTIKSKSTTK